MKKLLIATLAASISQFAFAQDPAEGLWKTINEDTGKAESIVKIWVAESELKGKIVRLINPEKENPVCDECEGSRKDQPIEGMEFIWGLQKDDDAWDDGEILDPGNGKVYSAKITPIENGSKLDVRGYIGFAFAGRSQIWERATEADLTAQPIATGELKSE